MPPSPADPDEAARWAHGRLRRRLLEGTWTSDLKTELRLAVGSQRAEVWGEAKQKVNPFKNINRELAVLYDATPAVMHDGPDVGDVAGSMELAGVWSLQARVQLYTLGLQECLNRVHVDARARPRYRPVYPDMVIGRPDPDRPDHLIGIEELRPRRHPKTGAPVWSLDILDVSDPDHPVYEIREAKTGLVPGEDWTGDYMKGPQSGKAYFYRRADGRPVLPYVLYHAQRLGDRLWNPYENIELVNATLEAAVLHLMCKHAFVNASWPQRWVANLRPAGADVVDGAGRPRSEVVTDPATVLLLETPVADGDDDRPIGQPMVGQWQPGADVDKLFGTLSDMLASIAQDAGVPPSDIQRLGGTARSGVAISLTNEGKRAAQRRFRPQFKDPDERLVGLTATLMNRADGGNRPESGYSVAHREIPLSPEELKARREHVLDLYDRGFYSAADAYMELHPGVSEAEARRRFSTNHQARLLAITAGS